MIIHHQNYTIKSTLSHDETIMLFEDIVHKSYTSLGKLQNNSHCFVEKIDIKGYQPIVFKIPRYRNKRRWERFLSLFRSGEAFRNHDSMMYLPTIHLKAPKPLFAAEKRANGMVVESFFTYFFIEGKIASAENIPAVLEALSLLHQQGLTRSDPKLENFLISENEVFFIDFRLKKPFLFSKTQCIFNLCKFFQTLPQEQRNLYIKPYQSPWFNFIYRINDVMIATRKMKKTLKKKLSKSH